MLIPVPGRNPERQKLDKGGMKGILFFPVKEKISLYKSFRILMRTRKNLIRKCNRGLIFKAA
jgi:hypothetical protein